MFSIADSFDSTAESTSLLLSLLKSTAIQSTRKPLRFSYNVVDSWTELDLPITSYRVPGQATACKLPRMEELPATADGLYRIEPGLTNLYASKAMLQVALHACYYWLSQGHSPSITVLSISARRFSDTRTSGPASKFNSGKAIDLRIAGFMRSDGDDYDPDKCAFLCVYCALAGANRVCFSDRAVVDVVNRVLHFSGKREVCEDTPGHECHVHLEMN